MSHVVHPLLWASNVTADVINTRFDSPFTTDVFNTRFDSPFINHSSR